VITLILIEIVTLSIGLYSRYGVTKSKEPFYIRSVAHYNLEDGTILETTSNPFWVACLYIKASEVKQEQEGNPNNEEIQKWTQKSLPKKFVLIGLLLNSKKYAILL
jgi:hypothetical protein